MAKKLTTGKDGKTYYGKGTKGGLAPTDPSSVAAPALPSLPKVPSSKTSTAAVSAASLTANTQSPAVRKMYSYLEKTKAAQSPTTQAILGVLVSKKEGVYRCCLRVELANQGIDAGQPASQIRDLRNAGVNIPKQARSICPVHNKLETLDQLFTPYITGDSYARAKYSPAEIAAIRAIIGNEDAFTARPTTNIEIDHRIPVARMRVSDLLKEDKVDITNAEEVKKRYQPLTRDNNLHKSRVCEKCVETNTKPTVFIGRIGIPSKLGGGLPFAEGKNDCSTCPFAHPEAFMSKVSYNG